MARDYRWLNRTRLNVHLLESRVQPGSLLTTGPAEMGESTESALGAGLLTPPQEETFGQLPRHGQETVPQQIPPAATQAESASDTVVPDALFEPELIQAPLADPLALESKPRSRLLRQRADVGVMTRQGEVAAPPASVSTPSRSIAHVPMRQSRDAVPPAVPVGFTPVGSANSQGNLSDAHKQTPAENYGRLPLSFEQNVGQFDGRVDFVARTGDMTTFLMPTAAVFALQNSESSPPAADQNSESADWRAGRVNALDASLQGVDTPRSPGVAVYMEIVGANPARRAAGVNPLEGKLNYFIGNDPSQWHANIPTFGRIEYQDVYPGIDLIYYGNNGALEYDFIVSPAADPNVITLDFAGAEGVEVDPQGALVLHTAAGDVVQHAPLTYQQEGGSRQEIASRYVLNGTSVRFEVGAYDPTQPLVIDPLVMGYSTFLGGTPGPEAGNGIAVDAAGNAYLSGSTDSIYFPTTPGAFDTSVNGSDDAFVAKLSADGTSLIYGTYLGGSGFDWGYGVAVDSAGNVYTTGYTGSGNFPTTPGAFDTSYNGLTDVFVAKLSADGTSLVYGTYLGGSALDIGNAIAVDVAGNAYVAGSTKSTNFPTTPGAFDTSYNDQEAFVARLRADGASLRYSTFLGGTSSEGANDLAVDASGSAYVVLRTLSNDVPTTAGAFDTTYNSAVDAFVAKLSPNAASLEYGTYLGGSSEDSAEGIALDAVGNAYLTGYTESANFPTTLGAFDVGANGNDDVFAVKLSADAATLVYATYLGGTNVDQGFDIAVDAAGQAYITGNTGSSFPTTPGAFDTSYNGGIFDAFLAKLSQDGASLVYGSYLGGLVVDTGYKIDVDSAGNAYVIGTTQSSNFPTTSGR